MYLPRQFAVEDRMQILDIMRTCGLAVRRRMLGGIVAFEIAVERLESKIKLNQHRPAAHAATERVCQRQRSRTRS